MKKTIVLLLCMVMLGTLLCGCDMFNASKEEDSSRRESITYPDAILPREDFFYESADTDSEVIGVSYAGQVVKVLGEQQILGQYWLKTERGWFCYEDYIFGTGT